MRTASRDRATARQATEAHPKLRRRFKLDAFVLGTSAEARANANASVKN